ncbi:MAG: dihydrolipoamide acetyltransferase family protein [Acidimicrobiales bacterium]
MAETVETNLVDFRLPSLGSDMDSGTVIGWRVAEGDTVTKGDVLLDVDTDKSEIEVEVWHDARVERILVGAGETVAVGTPIAQLAVGEAQNRTEASEQRRAGGAGAEEAEQPNEAEQPEEAEEPEARDGTGDPTTAEPAPTERHRASDLAPTPAAGDGARDRAPGAPPAGGGRGRIGDLVTPRTVYWPTTVPVTPRSGRPAPRGATDSTASAGERPTRRQNVVALAMEQSNREIPHFHLTTEIDLAPTIAWLEAANDERRPPDRILTAAVFLRAVALAVARHPTFNGSWIDGRFVPADTVALGVAIHMRDGTLMTPVIAEADHVGIDDLMASFRALVGRTRSGGLKSSDIAQPTITVTNLGDSGADEVAGLIRPPQVALVGFGRVRPRPVVIDDAVVVRPTVHATLSADHRANNGQAGAAFLTTLAGLVRAPEEL